MSLIVLIYSFSLLEERNKDLFLLIYTLTRIQTCTYMYKRARKIDSLRNDYEYDFYVLLDRA